MDTNNTLEVEGFRDVDISEVEAFINTDKFLNFISREAPSLETALFINQILEDSIEVLKEFQE